MFLADRILWLNISDISEFATISIPLNVGSISQQSSIDNHMRRYFDATLMLDCCNNQHDVH